MNLASFENGADAFAEEHFSAADAAAPRSPASQLVQAAAAAARTARIRIGLSSLLLALHNNVLAEDIVEPAPSQRPHPPVYIIGGPDSVTATIAALRDEHGIGYVNLRPSLTGLCPLPLQANHRGAARNRGHPPPSRQIAGEQATRRVGSREPAKATHVATTHLHGPDT